MPRAPTLKKIQLETGKDGCFRFAVVADTHSKPHAAAAQRVRELSPDAILHAGDIGALTVLDDLTTIAPVFAVRGNIDAHTPAVPEILVLEIVKGAALKLRLLLVHIAVYGVKLRADIARLAKSQQASLVVCGHSHIPFIARDRGIGVFNPGSIGPRRFGLPIVLGSIDLTDTSVALKHIDCETGKPWMP